MWKKVCKFPENFAKLVKDSLYNDFHPDKKIGANHIYFYPNEDLKHIFEICYHSFLILFILTTGNILSNWIYQSESKKVKVEVRKLMEI